MCFLYPRVSFLKTTNFFPNTSAAGLCWRTNYMYLQRKIITVVSGSFAVYFFLQKSLPINFESIQIPRKFKNILLFDPQNHPID